MKQFYLDYINRLTGEISQILCVITKTSKHPVHGEILHVNQMWGSKVFPKRFVKSVVLASDYFSKTLTQ